MTTSVHVPRSQPSDTSHPRQPTTHRASRFLVTVACSAAVAACGDLTAPETEPGNPSAGPPVHYPDIAGVYDLTGVITASDPAWGIDDGTRQVTVVTVQRAGDTSLLVGTFSDFHVIYPDGEILTGDPNSGSVSGVVHSEGAVVMELTFAGRQSRTGTARVW